MLLLQTRLPGELVSAPERPGDVRVPQLSGGVLRKLQVVCRVAITHALGLAERSQVLFRVLADRLQQPVAPLAGLRLGQH